MDDNRRTELFKLRRLSSLSWYEIAAKFDISEREAREEFCQENTRQSEALNRLSERFGIPVDQLDELFAYSPDREMALYADLDLRAYGSYTVRTVNLSLEYALGAALMGMGELRDVMGGGDMSLDVFPAQLDETLNEEWLPLNVPDLMRVYVRELDERERDEIGIEVAPRTTPSHETAR